MKIAFLGTNGWFDTDTGRTVSMLVSTADFDLVLDAGSGFFRLDERIGQDRPLFVFLSHFHLDHIHGLHTLPRLKPRFPVHFIVPPGGDAVLRQLLDQPFTKPIRDLGYDVTISEAGQGTEGLAFRARTLAMVHSSATIGIRIEHDGRSLAYCPDTGYCDNAVSLARGVDLLVTECAFRPGVSSPSWPHLNPETAARIAIEASARELVLTHFDARHYPTMATRAEAEQVARELFPRSRAAFDGLAIEW